MVTRPPAALSQDFFVHFPTRPESASIFMMIEQVIIIAHAIEFLQVRPPIHDVTGNSGPSPRGWRGRFRTHRRFGWVLAFSLLVHAIVVLGISFVMPTQAENRSFAPPMKIMLVSTPSATEPEAPDTLAQSDSRGEDDGAEPLRWSMDGGAARLVEQLEREQLLLEQQFDAWLSPEPQAAAENSPAPEQGDRDALMQRIDLALLNARANPRERFVHANSRASDLAPYLENWRLVVERVGNLNYPEAARRQRLEGKLVLDVAVRADGSVADISVLRSSGHPELDDGAERIVRIAAPFGRFPESLRRDYDILHIIRTWKFSQNTLEDVSR